jgi:prophage tail gpP-like protein
MADEIVLTVDGQKYGGWTGMSINHSLEDMAGSFSLSLTMKWPDASSRTIKQGQSCTVKIGKDLVLTGYNDDWLPSYDANEVRLEVQGRSKTCDLVDCSVVHSSGQFSGLTLAEIAKRVCQPFSIDVVAEVDTGDAFGKVTVEQGETAFELLDRLAKQRAILMTTNPAGQLVLTKASSDVIDVRLELGVNILAARGRFSWRDRASQYIVKGSASAGGSSWDDVSPKQVGGMQTIVTDSEITRYRPKIVLSEDIMTAGGSSTRGQWQKQRMIGQSNQTEITVAGWRTGGETGDLWTVNKRVQIVDPLQGLDVTWLINTVMFSESNDTQGGRITVLGFVPPEAMDLPAESARKKTTKTTSTWGD